MTSMENAETHKRDLRILDKMIEELKDTGYSVHCDSEFAHARACKFMITTAAKAMGFTPRQLAALERKLNYAL